MKTTTIIRHLKSLLAHLEQNDFSTESQDKALRQAVTMLTRYDKLERFADVIARCCKDRECVYCLQDGEEPNPNCAGAGQWSPGTEVESAHRENEDGTEHGCWDMPNDDAVSTLHSLIDWARELTDSD